jgi:hypothetical protein
MKDLDAKLESLLLEMRSLRTTSVEQNRVFNAFRVNLAPLIWLFGIYVCCKE